MRLEELINKHQHQLNQTDYIIWKYIYNHKNECRRMSVHELAAACNVSGTTVVRFAQKLSLDGFSDLKTLLKLEKDQVSIPEDDAIKKIIDQYQRVSREMEQKNFNRLNELVHNANRIIAYGSGYVQSNVVKELKRLFLFDKVLIYEIQGKDEIISVAKTLTPNDLVIIVSLSGETPLVVEVARQLRLQGVPLISFTHLQDNTLAALSTENIYIATAEFSLYADQTLPPYKSLMIYFLVIEIWFIKYQSYKKAQLDNEKG
ncbi:sugar isomerase (sis) [Lucifera butyrica]|uniref:Sugar isomerase (Sis) n=2 Tax=Lucifera butyrica TaxID=1351585 RepID=A0A498R3L3_9FIRM|nr:sugar isomerase (sis) [Lucifera butyrica]